MVQQWELPELLLTLMDDENAQKPRVRNVHWQSIWHAIRPTAGTTRRCRTITQDIGELLRMPAEQVMVMLGVDAGTICDLTKPHE